MNNKYEVKYYKYQLLNEQNIEAESQQQPPVQQTQFHRNTLPNTTSQKTMKSLDSVKMSRVYSSSNNNDEYNTADEDDEDYDVSLRSAKKRSIRFIKTNSIVSTNTF
jgi:hypothetical protein